jgi:uncharacterized membrane protein SpoIIM required for sporulation
MPSADADEMARDFTQLVDDLAYAKTFYPSSKVTRYINSQASRIYLSIYKNRKEESSRLLTFWKYDLPLTIYRHHRTVLFVFLFFLLFFSIAFFVSMKDDTVPGLLLGPDYIRATQDNIDKGNPFGIYEHGSSFWMWIGIMINNIWVSMRMFLYGLFLGIPTLYHLGFEASRIGVFDQFMASKGLGLDFWLVVFVHGTLEITAIIISAAAGVILGKSVLFPGTAKRLQSFKRGAKDGIKIIVGLIPVLALAAFFEGFITRLYNNVPILTTIIFILSVLFVIWYFVIYPIMLGRRMRLSLNEEEV